MLKYITNHGKKYFIWLVINHRKALVGIYSMPEVLLNILVRMTILKYTFILNLIPRRENITHTYTQKSELKSFIRIRLI